MNNSEKEPTDNPKYIKIFICICIGILIFSVSYYFLIKNLTGNDPNIRGTFGDMFGALNAIFSGFAFAGVIITILMQMKELELTRHELRRSADAQEESQKALNEQLKSMELTAKIQNLESYFNTIGSTNQDIEKARIARAIIESSNLQYFILKENLVYITPRFSISYEPIIKNEFKGKNIIFHFKIKNQGAIARIIEMKLPTEVTLLDKDNTRMIMVIEGSSLTLEVNSKPKSIHFDLVFKNIIFNDLLWVQKVSINLEHNKENEVTISNPVLTTYNIWKSKT